LVVTNNWRIPIFQLSYLFFMKLSPPKYPFFPYTTLFRSNGSFEDEMPLHDYRQGRETIALGRRPLTIAANFTDGAGQGAAAQGEDRKSTRLNSSHVAISYAVLCLKKKNESKEPLKKLERE